jgi:hypothetical protein
VRSPRLVGMSRPAPGGHELSAIMNMLRCVAPFLMITELSCTPVYRDFPRSCKTEPDEPTSP